MSRDGSQSGDIAPPTRVHATPISDIAQDLLRIVPRGDDIAHPTRDIAAKKEAPFPGLQRIADEGGIYVVAGSAGGRLPVKRFAPSSLRTVSRPSARPTARSTR